MDVKNCPKCGKELPAEITFCPFCMHSSVEEVVITVAPLGRKRIVPYMIAAVAILLALALVILLLPQKQTTLPATATPTKASLLSFSTQAESPIGNPTTGSVFPSVPFSSVSSFPDTSQADMGHSSAHAIPSRTTADISMPSSIPSIASSSPVSNGSSVVSSQPVTSQETELERRIRLLHERSLKQLPQYLALWNKAAREIGYEEYAIVGYDSNPKAIGGLQVNMEEDYFLYLTNVQLAGGCMINNLRWERSAVQYEKGCGCNVQLLYPSVSDEKAIPDEDIKYINYLALASFTKYRNDSFVEEFYTDEGWAQLPNMNSGIHNAWHYRKRGSYGGFRFEDSYTVFFEDLEINQDIIAAMGTNISRSKRFEFEYWHTTAWLNAEWY